MKIIQNNYIKPPSKYPKEIICPNCKSILEIEETDINLSLLFLFHGGRESTDSGERVYCPCCNTIIEIIEKYAKR